MNWNKVNEPTKEFDTPHNYVFCTTPLGIIKIEWNSWKKPTSFGIILNDVVWIGTEYYLESAKNKAREYLDNKLEELQQFLK